MAPPAQAGIQEEGESNLLARATGNGSPVTLGRSSMPRQEVSAEQIKELLFRQIHRTQDCMVPWLG
jgi:hypothetical protein